jgi:hypothetical protein
MIVISLLEAKEARGALRIEHPAQFANRRQRRGLPNRRSSHRPILPRQRRVLEGDNGGPSESNLDSVGDAGTETTARSSSYA